MTVALIEPAKAPPQWRDRRSRHRRQL